MGEQELKNNPHRHDAEQDYKNGLKYAEIAEKYNVSLNTVKSWKKRYGWTKDSKKGCTPNREKGCTFYEEKGAEQIPWLTIENEYVTDISRTPISTRKLAEKYNVNYKTISKKCTDGNWTGKREDYRANVGQKIIEKATADTVDRISRLLNLADTAADKAEQALSEVDRYIVRKKKKKKKTKYTEKKPCEEVTEEIEELSIQQGPVDRQGLLFITNVLKNLKDVYALDSLNESPDGAADDGFIDALNATAQEDWADEG